MIVNKNDIVHGKTNYSKIIGNAYLKNSFAYNADNTGDGTITGVNGTLRTPTEVWTLTCTTEATDGGTFSVIGAISGQKADATVGTDYDNGQIKFKINDGSTDWAKGDIITVSITRNFVEITTTKPFSTVQVVTKGDLSTCVLEIKGSLDSENFVTTELLTLTADEITSGYIGKSSHIVVTNSKIEFEDIEITKEAEVIVLIK